MSFVVFNSSAGSGKTYALVREYLMLAIAGKDENPFRHILAMTFTNKAAAEMKSRVLQVLISVIKKESGPMEADLMAALKMEKDIFHARCEKLFYQILHNYSDYNISTIDKFMHKVIRTFARDLRLPLNFEVELDEVQLVKKSVAALFSRIGEDELLTSILLKFSMEKYEEGKSWSLDLDLQQMTSSYLHDIPPAYLSFLESIQTESMYEAFQKIRNVHYTQKSFVASLGKKYFQLLSENGVSKNDMAGGKNGISKYFEYLKEGKDDKWIPGVRVSSYAGENKWSASKVDASTKETIESIAPQCSALYEQMQHFLEKEYAMFIFQKLALSRMYQLILFNEIQKEITTYKSENNIVHISDFNRTISKIVSREPAPFIYERLGEKFRHFLIDEFQDTSVLQWQNLLPLVENSLASANQVVIVGDGKQAIYRWRGGEVEQFSLMPQLHPDIEDEFSVERAQLLATSYLPKRLSTNYRSAKRVVQFNNSLYAHVAQTLPEHLQEIYSDITQKVVSESDGFVEVHLYEEEDADTFVQWNFNRLAQQIQKAQELGYAYSDMAVLCIKRAETVEVANLLATLNIEVLSEESLLVQNNPDVQQLVLFLEILNAKDAFSYQNSVYLLCEKLAQHGVCDVDPIEIYDKIVKGELLFEDWIESVFPGMQWKFLSDKPILEILEHIVRVAQFNPTDSEVLTFVDSAFHFVRKNGQQLNGFMEWWQQNKDNVSVSTPEGINAVRVMTVHKSKGLEFPVVFFPFVSNAARMTKDELWTDVQNDQLKGLNVVLLPVTKQLEHTQVSDMYELEKNRSVLDRVNLMYVATTRAMNRLIILSETGKKGNQLSMADMLTQFCTSSLAMVQSEGAYRLGEDRKVDKQKSIPSQASIVPVQTESWRKKLRISVHSGYEQEVSKQENPRHFGIMMHYLLSRFETEAAINEELNRLLEVAEINESEYSDLKINVENIIRLEKSVIVDKVINKWNERELLSDAGHIYRPDKVVETERGYVLIDYKSGEIKDDHKIQLNTYADVLLKMKCTIRGKYLIYSGMGEILEV